MVRLICVSRFVFRLYVSFVCVGFRVSCLRSCLWCVVVCRCVYMRMFVVCCVCVCIVCCVVCCVVCVVCGMSVVGGQLAEWSKAPV